MRQTVGKLNLRDRKVQNVMDSENYFLAKGYSQPRNIVFFAEECLGPEVASTTPPWTTLCQKSLLGFVYFCTGSGQCFQYSKRLN